MLAARAPALVFALVGVLCVDGENDTFDTLLTIVNQVRGTLRIKLQGGMPKPERDEAERLQEGLQGFSKGLRQVLLGAQHGDAAAEQAGLRLLDEAVRALDGKV